MTQNRIFSDDNAKAEKAGDYGYLNIIHYLAPTDIAGVGNVCPHASPACAAACLGWFSGHAAMVKDVERDRNATRDSRIDKTRAFMRDRRTYLARMVLEIARHKRRAIAAGVKLCVRLNGSSDIAWEGIRAADNGMTLFEIFSDVQFVDYTKNPRRFDRQLPANYCLTFSRSEVNEAVALELLARDVNVAIVFAGAKPDSWHGYPVIDGDQHDLRMLDPRGVVVGLSPKGKKARDDRSGFVVR
jgi:hypothetical protein